MDMFLIYIPLKLNKNYILNEYHWTPKQIYIPLKLNKNVLSIKPYISIYQSTISVDLLNILLVLIEIDKNFQEILSYQA